MKRFVIDSSVVLAIVKVEHGNAAATDYVADAAISSVSLAEIVTKCVEWELDPDEAVAFVHGAGIDVHDFSGDDAILAGRLAKTAKKGILSLGDRACIATAIRLGATAVTADRVWATLDLPCPVELIR